MGCSLVEVELVQVVRLADCHLSSAVAVVFDQVSIENGTGGKTAKKRTLLKQIIFKTFSPVYYRDNSYWQ